MTARRALLAVALAAALPGTANAQPSPVAVVESFQAVLLNVMQNARALGPQGRAQRLRPALESTFNLPAMTRIAVGPTWPQIAPAEQQALTAAFSEWSVANYAARFDGYGGQSFQVNGESTLPNNDRLVRTQINRVNREPVQVNYLLRDAGGGQWRVVDLYLAGTVSEIASRRSEFTAILRDGGAPRLIAELRARTQRLLEG
ncbi:MAG: ABC transporter substrate-binding protein [Acetobacteraceae bacterium]|nr:ABC transporter substrate-binding protein [Acetobacteraceae bacterium]